MEPVAAPSADPPSSDDSTSSEGGLPGSSTTPPPSEKKTTFLVGKEFTDEDLEGASDEVLQLMRMGQSGLLGQVVVLD